MESERADQMINFDPKMIFSTYYNSLFLNYCSKVAVKHDFNSANCDKA